MGIPLGRVRVQISSDYEIQSISAWVQTQNQQEARGMQGQADKDRLAQYLCEAYGLDEGQVFIYGL